VLVWLLSQRRERTLAGGMESSSRIVTRMAPGRRRVLVFDRRNNLHFPLTVFAGEAVRRSSSSTARLYLNTLIPFFDSLDAGESDGAAHRTWDDPPEAIRQAVEDYLVERLKCKVREHHAGFQLVSLTDGARTTVRVFLSALKLFYRVMHSQHRYDHANPLVDGPSAMLAEVEERISSNNSLPPIPEVSGVVPPRKRRLSDSYFKLIGESWTPQVIDDPELPVRILSGGRRIGWRLGDQCITRILFESGCRVSEVVGLSLHDWAARGLLQEAQAFSKGSHGRRVKFVRFSAATAKLLRRYFDTERRQLDCNHYTLDEYLRQSQGHGTNLNQVALFLSRRRKQVTAKGFREGCWNPACDAAGIVADVHQARHWYVTQMMRSIYETSHTQSEIDRRLRELIEYMSWRSGWETLQAYQHYFDPQRHAEMQDRLYQRLNAALQDELEHQAGRGLEPQLPRESTSQAEVTGSSDESDCDSDLEYLLALGGKRGPDDRA
jgi:integrase